MFLLVGLGNPGSKYEGNRHNIGFMAVDELVRRHNFAPHNFSPWRAKFQGEISEGQLGGVKTLVLKPSTFMNNSGQAVGEAMRFYKLQPADVLVMYDELDLAPGKVKIKKGGGAGGHNGIRSMDDHIGKDYRRLRIGIGHPGDKNKVSNYVLGDFAKADQDWIDPLLTAIADCSDMLAKGEDVNFSNKLALKLQSNEPPSARGQKSAKGKSHIHQARDGGKTETPKSGPMADMLKKLFTGKEKD